LHVLEELSHPCRPLQDLSVKHQDPPHPTETSGIMQLQTFDTNET
jgi:hypothetical protein